MSHRYSFRSNRTVVSLLLVRQHGQCAYCGRQTFMKVLPSEALNQATLDHKVPLALGGEPYGDNVVVACRLCNSHKGPLTVEVYLRVRDNPTEKKAAEKQALALIEALSEAQRRRLRERARMMAPESLSVLMQSLQPILDGLKAGVAKSGDAVDLKSAVERRAGSTPVAGTKARKQIRFVGHHVVPGDFASCASGGIG